MTGPGNLAPRARRDSAAMLGAAAVVLVGVLALAPTASAGPLTGAGATYTALAWGDGSVTCLFPSDLPVVSVSPAKATGAGLQVGMGSIQETTAAGLLAAQASLSGAVWSIENLTNATYYLEEFTARLPVNEVVGGVVGLQVGTVNVSWAVGLARTAANGSLEAREAALSISLTGWPVASALLAAALGGSLEVNLTVAPLAPATEQLGSGGPDGAIVSSNLASTGRPLVYLTMTDDANATMPTGHLLSIGVAGALLGLTAGHAVLEVTFGSNSSQARSVQYTGASMVVPASLSIPTNVTLGPVRVPTTDLLAVVGAAVAVSLMIAGVTRRVRATPSDLEYVDGEAP